MKSLPKTETLPSVQGGLGDAVLASLAMVRNVVVKKLAVNAVPRSGKTVLLYS